MANCEICGHEIPEGKRHCQICSRLATMNRPWRETTLHRLIDYCEGEWCRLFDYWVEQHATCIGGQSAVDEIAKKMANLAKRADLYRDLLGKTFHGDI